MSIENENNKIHKINISERNKIFLTGINKINFFDASDFEIDSIAGLIHIKGEKLEIIKLDLQVGELLINGLINSVSYFENKKSRNKESFISKLFK